MLYNQNLLLGTVFQALDRFTGIGNQPQHSAETLKEEIPFRICLIFVEYLQGSALSKEFPSHLIYTMNAVCIKGKSQIVFREKGK